MPAALTAHSVRQWVQEIGVRRVLFAGAVGVVLGRPAHAQDEAAWRTRCAAALAEETVAAEGELACAGAFLVLPSERNRLALAVALATRGGRERERLAGRLVETAVESADPDVAPLERVTLIGRYAAEANALSGLDAAVFRLEELDPQGVDVHLYQVPLLPLDQRDRQIELARAKGASPERLAQADRWSTRRISPRISPWVSEAERVAVLEPAWRFVGGAPPPESFWSNVDWAGVGALAVLGAILGVFGGVPAGWVALLGVLVLLAAIVDARLRLATERLLSNPHDDVRFTSSLRVVYRGTVAALCLWWWVSLPAIGFLSLGLLVAFFAVAIFGGVVFIGPIIRTVLATWALLRSMVSGQDTDPPGLPMSRDRMRLWATVDEVALQVGTRTADRVVLHPGTLTAVSETGGLWSVLRGTSERNLIIGAYTLEGMSEAAFRAILAHEFGHFNDRDAAGGAFSLGVVRYVARLLRALAEHGVRGLNPMWLFSRAFLWVLLRVTRRASRLQELCADQVAVRLYGADALGSGLRQCVVAEARLHHVLRDDALARLLGAGEIPPNLYERVPPVEEAALSAEVAAVLARPPQEFDTHPAMHDRLAFASRVGGKLVAADPQGTAWDIVGDREALQQRLTTLFFARENASVA